MSNTKVIEINKIYNFIRFDNGFKMYSVTLNKVEENSFDDIRNLELKDFEGLEFDTSTTGFFKRFEGGTELIALNGKIIKISGYCYLTN